MKKLALLVNLMKAKELCFIAVIAAIEFVVFSSFSFVLYLEFITLTVVLFAMTFKRHQAVLGAIVFGLLNMCIQGVTPWSMMYVLVYPTYSFLIATLRPYLEKHFSALCILTGFLSFLTGQVLQIPFMLISDKITLLYIIAGLKTSLLQGGMAIVSCWLCYRPIDAILKPIERRLNNEKTI